MTTRGLNPRMMVAARIIAEVVTTAGSVRLAAEAVTGDDGCAPYRGLVHYGAAQGMSRPSWEEYFEIARVVTTRATWVSGGMWAVLVKNRQINHGVQEPRGVPHCLDIGCLRDRLGIPSGERHELCRGLHAEQNVIICRVSACEWRAEMYRTHQPCVLCAKMIVNAALRPCTMRDYPTSLSSGIRKRPTRSCLL